MTTNIGNLELLVMLAVLRLGENAYGVTIADELVETVGREVALGSIYAALERLEVKGLLTSELGESTAERGGKAKKYFRVTAKGLRDLRETRQALMKLWRRLPQLEGEQE